jgi:LuxR family maltose regulon positive regulatory protein
MVMRSLARGDLDGAAAEIEKLDHTARSWSASPSYLALYAASRVIFAVRQGDLKTAAEWGDRLPHQAEGIADVWLRHVPARLLIAKGENARAAELLEALYEKADRAGAQGIVILTRVCQTLAASTRSEALAFLSDALGLGQPEGFIRTFVDEGRLLAPILREAISTGVSRDYGTRLLRVIEAEERRRAEYADTVTRVPPPVPLSSRELEILRLVADGLSNGEIAERLVISLGTVKTHVHNITEKLGARDRLQAVNAARKLGLL